MSRVLLFSPKNRHQHEVEALCNRSWSVYGSRSTTGGGSTTVSLSRDAATSPYLQLGRMVLVDHASLPPWAGMIDTPWDALPPVGVTVYDAAYLFKLRSPDSPVKLSGTTFQIVSQIVELINDQGETYLRMGEEGREGSSREETFDQRAWWDQILALLKRRGREMLVRPEIREGQLFILVDVRKRIGHDTGYLLHDGPNANLQIRNARVDGQIWNRIIGIGTQRSDRIYTDPQVDKDSISRYRLRTRTEQSQAKTAEALDETAQMALEHDKQPWFTLEADALDVGDTFDTLAPGNGVIVHASEVVLHGGISGWRGPMRIMTMKHDEAKNSVAMTLETQI